jgi:hypothetical protein
MANSLLKYIKENPIETALTVASIHPAVRLGKFAYKAGKTLLKTRPVTLYRGVHPVPKTRTLSEAKNIVKMTRIDAKLKNYKTNPYGNWFTSSKTVAARYANQRGLGGSLLKVKVPYSTLEKIKKVQPPISKPVTKMNKKDREFFGVIPPKFRRKAKVIKTSTDKLI